MDERNIFERLDACNHSMFRPLTAKKTVKKIAQQNDFVITNILKISVVELQASRQASKKIFNAGLEMLRKVPNFHEL